MTDPTEQNPDRVPLKAADIIKAAAGNLESLLGHQAEPRSDEGVSECELVKEWDPYDSIHPSGFYALGYSWDSEEGGFGTVLYWDGVQKTWLGSDIDWLPFYGCKGPYQDLEQARDAAKRYEW